jgi:hypothetical protein
MIFSKTYVIAWRCWYEDLSGNIVEYNSVTSTLNNLPTDGFQTMKLFFDDGTSGVMMGFDYFYFFSDQENVTFGLTNDLPETILSSYPNALIKNGKYISDETFNNLVGVMMSSVSPI